MWLFTCFACFSLLSALAILAKSFIPARDPQKSAAEAVIKARVDFTKVRSDDHAREMVVKPRDGAEEYRVSYADLALGRLPMKQPQGGISVTGATDLSQVPAWVPRLPGTGAISGAFHQNLSDRQTGMIVATCECAPETLEKHMLEAARKLHLTAGRRSVNTFNGNETRSQAFRDDLREIRLNLYLQAGKPLNVQIGYTELKPPAAPQDR